MPITSRTALQWADRFETPAPEERVAAACSAARLGRDVVPYLVEILSGEREPGRPHSALARRGALLALRQLRTEARPAIEALTKLLGDEDAAIREDAAGVLGSIGRDARPAASALVAALLRPSRSGANEPFQAARALGQIGGPEAVDGLTRALSNEADTTLWMCRAQAATALAELGPEAKAAVPALIAKLDDRHALLRQRAAMALQRIDPSTAARLSSVAASP